MTCYGQIVESRQSDNNPWVAVWDLELGGQWVAAVKREPKLKLGQLVTFTRGEKLASDVRPIRKDELPEGLKPLVDSI